MKLNTLPYGSHWVINSICKSFEKVGEGWGPHGADSEKAP